MVEFRLIGGKTGLIDDGDFHLLEGRRWYALKKGRVYYAFSPKPRNSSFQSVYLHQLIMGKQRVDHINHDGLDNRRENLRPCTQRQNTFNQRKRNHKRRITSEFKGVSFARNAPLRPWRAYISVGGKRIGGQFKTEEQAARAYDALALKFHGDFAVLNFPHERISWER